MNFNKLKTAAAVAVITMGIAGYAMQANAQTPVLANITTSSAITVADVSDMEFGTWFLLYRNADAFTLTMATDGNITVGGLGGGPLDSQALNLVAGAGEAEVTVDLPVGANGIVLQMQRDAIVDFLDGGLTLQNITYETTTEGANLALAQATDVDVTVITGGAPESVTFGGEIAVSGMPADATHSASFNVSFAY